MERLAPRSFLFTSSCTVWFVLTSASSAGQFYVSPLGNDAFAGSAGAPWRTLQRAADAVGPGDVVNVLPGQYAGFDLSTSGTNEQRISFVAQPGAIINQRNARTPDGINLEGASYVTVDGFTVTGVPRAGIRAVGADDDFSRFVAIRNNRTDQNGRWGIFTGFSEDLLIERNETSRSGDEHGIYVSNSADRPTVRDNLVWGNHGSGIQLNADASLGADGIITGALIERNTIYDNGLGGGAGINLDGVQQSTIQNNLLYDNHATGIALFMIDGAEGSKDNTLVNNTVVQAANGRWALLMWNGSSGNTLHNNILLNQHSFRGSLTITPDSLPGLVSDYNLVMSRFTTDDGDTVQSLAQWQAFSGQDAHSFTALLNDVFVDRATHDYRPKANGPAYNAAFDDAAPSVDLLNAVRPWDGRSDIGALERRPTLLGDVNADGRVDIFDVAAISDAWGATDSTADANADGVVDIFDVAVVSANWTGDETNSNNVPEPANSALLLAAATLGFVGRRALRQLVVASSGSP